MPVKVCYKSEIHRVSKDPKDFASLLHSLKEIFHNEIPPKFTLQYEDSEGDKIVLANDEDYKLAVESGLSKTLKIYLIEVEDTSNSSFISKNFLDNLELSSPKTGKKPEEKVEKPSKKLSPEPIKEQKYVQATIEDVTICEKVNKSFRRCFKNKDKKVEYSNIPCECQGEIKASGRPCRNCHGTGLLKNKEAKKREMLQNLVRDTLYKELPKIAKDVKQLLEVPEQSYKKVTEAPQKKIEEPKVKKPIHHRITCDVCGMRPIVGVRYKCTVTEDYDMCENCEAIVDHPYPLLKIKNDSQHPIQVITVLNEDAYPEQSGQGFPEVSHQGLSRHSQETQNLVNNLLSKISENSAQVIKPTQEQNTQTIPAKINKEEETPGQANDETPGENKDETPQGNNFDATFVKEINTIPEKIEVKDLTIYKTVSLRNVGLSAWPKNCFIESEGEISGEGCKLPSIESGKDFSTVLIIQSPKKAGNFQSKWRFGYVDEKGNKQSFGKNFTVEFKIVGDKPEEILIADIKQNEKKQYSSEITEKAKAILEIFPQAKFDEVCEYIEQDSEKSIDDLVQDYMILLQ